MIWYVWHLSKFGNPQPIPELLETYVDIMRKTSLFDGRHPAPSGNDGPVGLDPPIPQWDALKAELSMRIAAHGATGGRMLVASRTLHRPQNARGTRSRTPIRVLGLQCRLDNAVTESKAGWAIDLGRQRPCGGLQRVEGRRSLRDAVGAATAGSPCRFDDWRVIRTISKEERLLYLLFSILFPAYLIQEETWKKS